MSTCIVGEIREMSSTVGGTISLFPNSLAARIFVMYLIVEALFLLYQVIYIIPRANLFLPPHDCLDYGRERHKLLIRILNRIQKRALRRKRPFQKEFKEYLLQWFHLPSDNSDQNCSFSPTEFETRELLCWAFFGKRVSDVKEEDWEMHELNKLIHILKKEYSIQFDEDVSKESRIMPKLVSLEKVNPIPRPLIIYAAVKAFGCLGSFILRMHGFQFFTTPTHKLRYWFNSNNSPHSMKNQNHCLSPLLFFHGLAPAASTVYLPIVLYGLCRSGEYQHRPIFFFENKNISYGMTFTPVFDEATAAESVVEALEAHGYYSNDWETDVSTSSSSSKPIHISVCGHSFGTCVVTWLLRSPKICNLIKNVVLLDPVSILLSEPDVMNNFLYKSLPEIIRKGTLFDFAIFFVSRTEVFTEHYLRRHFSWYNSELWLEDLHNTNIKLLIALSGKDEIVNSSKVQEEIETQNYRALNNKHLDNSAAFKKHNKVRLIYWPESGHASCVMDTSLWKNLRTMFLLQENEIN